jgi:hypothetical protein
MSGSEILKFARFRINKKNQRDNEKKKNLS